MSNSLLTPTIIAKEGLMQLRNNMVMGGLVHREYKEEFKKVGDTIEIRKPVKFLAKDGATRIQKDVTEGYITLQISKRKHVSWSFTTQDLTLTIDQYSERYVTPAGIELGNVVDTDLLGLYNQIANCAGTPGSTPATFMALGNCAIRLDNAAVPDDGRRRLVLNPDAKWNMADGLKGSFDPNLAKDTVRQGLLGQVARMTIYGDQNVARHTTGSLAGDTGQINGAVSDTYSTSTQTSSVTLKSLTGASGTLKAGDVFTIGSGATGVYAINPRNRQSTGQLQTFVITADATVTSNAATVTVFPRIITSGAYQTVSQAAADSASVAFYGNVAASTSYPQNLAFHRNALALVMMPLELPRSAVFKARSTMDGVSVRVIEDYDSEMDEEVIRLDILYATKAIYPELAVRLWG